MFRNIVCVAIAVIGSAMPHAVRAQLAPHPVASTPVSPPLRTTNPTLDVSLRRIASRSALWREAVEAVRPTGRFALVLTPDQVVVADALDGDGAGVFDPTVLAEVAPVPDEDSQVRVVLVVVNLALIEDVHHRYDSLPVEMERDLDRILIHEIYGHAFPYLLAGDLSGRCPDPAPKQRASDACSIRRENAVRAELGLGRRAGYGLDGLALARSFR